MIIVLGFFLNKKEQKGIELRRKELGTSSLSLLTPPSSSPAPPLIFSVPSSILPPPSSLTLPDVHRQIIEKISTEVNNHDKIENTIEELSTDAGQHVSGKKTPKTEKITSKTGKITPEVKSELLGDQEEVSSVCERLSEDGEPMIVLSEDSDIQVTLSSLPLPSLFPPSSFPVPSLFPPCSRSVPSLFFPSSFPFPSLFPPSSLLFSIFFYQSSLFPPPSLPVPPLALSLVPSFLPRLSPLSLSGSPSHTNQEAHKEKITEDEFIPLDPPEADPEHSEIPPEVLLKLFSEISTCTCF
jgi:hypothetical protein